MACPCWAWRRARSWLQQAQSAQLAQLDLFAHSAAPGDALHDAPVKQPIAPDPLRARLAAIDPDSLSPRAALDLLYALRDAAHGELND